MIKKLRLWYYRTFFKMPKYDNRFHYKCINTPTVHTYENYAKLLLMEGWERITDPWVPFNTIRCWFRKIKNNY